MNNNNQYSVKPSGVPWLGDMPTGWRIGRLVGLYVHRNEKVSDKDFPPLSVTMKGVMPQLATAAKSDDGDNRKLVRKGDFAINSRSDRRGSCGISAYDGSVSLINTILTPRGQMSPAYFNWLFHTDAFADEFYKWGHGIVDDLWTTRWSEMKRIVVVFPPLAEQRAIAEYLDETCGAIDAAIAEAKKGIEEYKSWKKSLIFEAVTGKRRVGAFNADKRESEKMKSSGILWIGAIPEGWKVSRVKEVATIKTGNTPDKQYQNEYYSTASGVPWIKAENLGFMVPISQAAEYLTEEGVKQGRVFPPRTVFVCCIASIGKVGYSEKVASCNQQLNALVFNSRMYWKYGFYVTIAAEEEYLVRACGNVVKILNSSEQGLIAVPLPSIPEQQAIADYLDEKCAAIDAMVAEKEALIADLEAYKKSLIYETVTGKREVA